tara:strand:+ start:1600 stop:1806 length:207 start_codon:yes stop_codon:yes gene_type:complete
MEYDERHGGPFDRGGADSYYQRGYNPHYFTGASYQSSEVPMHNMTAEEITAYTKGYNENENSSNFKEW